MYVGVGRGWGNEAISSNKAVCDAKKDCGRRVRIRQSLRASVCGHVLLHRNLEAARLWCGTHWVCK